MAGRGGIFLCSVSCKELIGGRDSYSFISDGVKGIARLVGSNWWYMIERAGTGRKLEAGMGGEAIDSRYWQAGLGVVQCCNILPSLVWECDLWFSLPLLRGFDHSCGAGNPTSKWGGFPGGRGRPSLILRYQRWRGVGGFKSDFQVGLIVISNWNINFDNPSLQWHTHTFAGLV